MTKLFPLEDIKGTPDQRRELLLAVKRAAKRDKVKMKIWWDATGLHVEAPKAFLDSISKKMPKSDLPARV